MVSSTSGGILPSYQRFVNGVPVPQQRRGGLFRLREKYLILLGIIVLLCICYSGFVFLPDGPEAKTNIVRKALRDAWEADPKDLVIPPPKNLVDSAGKYGHSNRSSTGGNKILLHEHEDFESDPHRENDRKRLLEKINEAQIPPPNNQNVPVPGVSFGGDLTQNIDAVNEQRRQKIKEMMIVAWDGYAKYAWGSNELRPVSKTGHSASIFGSGSLGATIIDAVDTLYIMGLLDRYENGRKWIEMSLNLNDMRGDLSVFETNIRFVGGLLSIYGLTRDEMYARKAAEIADLLLPAFNTPTGIPLALINARTGSGKNWGWASGGSSILSEFGTLHLEFEYLSVITGKSIYREKVQKVRDVVAQLERPDGLYPNYVNPKTGRWGSKHVSVGALGDSFYEYLLKSWLVTNKRDVQAKQMYDDAMDAIFQHLVQRSPNGLTYIAEMRGSRLDHKMDHLACFIAGLFALHAVNEANETRSSKYMDLGKELTHTCHESYIRTDTHLGPESFRFTNEFEAKTINDREKYYILRPEVIEAYFYLWRTTKDPKYRDWAWDAAQAIERYCKTDNGYSGIRNVYTADPSKDDVQQSFFLAETLKYLYLVFSPDDVIPLNKWVFNTEAHPFPVRFEDSDHVMRSVTTGQNSINRQEAALEAK